MKNTLPDRVRLGVFEVDLRAGELREGERVVRLQQQPFQILIMLLERDGEVLSREEIQKKLWPNETVVEFDHSINTAIKKLRRALGDSAEDPKYVETVARRGYRLLLPVKWPTASDSSSGTVGIPLPRVTATVVSPRPEPVALSGRTVSHYRVLEIVGGGGMGVVFRAEDLKLGRQVALKFLPEELGSEPAAMERFSREARAASSLDHINICSIHEFGEHDGQPFIVMPLLKGETLRDHLTMLTASNQKLSLDRLLDIAIQITDGLQVAHEKGILHRDIKPANIFLTSTGVVKLLDFGLVKMMAETEDVTELTVRDFGPAAGNAILSGDGTQMAAPEAGTRGYPRAIRIDDKTLTCTGVAMGTAGYMSPEQVRGEKLDARSDLFSFGLVLYEMAAGQRAFSGETAAIVHDAIVNRAPAPLQEINPQVPPRLASIIDRALQKDRERRHECAAEMGTALRMVCREHQAGIGPANLARGRRGRWLAALACGVLLVCVTGLLLFRAKRPRPEAAKELVARQLTSVDTAVLGTIAVSPDGKQLAYLDGAKGVSLLQIASGETRSFPNTAAFFPMIWLADGEHLFVTHMEELSTWKMSARDGSMQKFDDRLLYPLSSPDGKVFTFRSEGRNAIWSIDGEGKSLPAILSVEPPWKLDGFTWSPGGRRVIYTKWQPIPRDAPVPLKASATVEVDSCDVQGHCLPILSEPRLLLEGYLSDVLWLADGRVVFALRELPPNEQDSNLWALQVDPKSGTPQGKPKRLTNWMGSQQGALTASADGKRLVSQRIRFESTAKIAELGANGRDLKASRPLNSTTWSSQAAGWMPDGSALFLATSYGEKGIFVQKATDHDPHPLIRGPDTYASPVISPDGKWLLYTESQRNGSVWLKRMPVTGGPSATLLSGELTYRCAKAPSNLCLVSELQGKQLVFYALDPLRGVGREVMRFDIRKDSNDVFSNWSLSPDGKNIALVDYGTSREQVWILSTIDGSRRAVRLRGWPVLERVNWSADNARLYISGAADVALAGILKTDLAGNFTVLLERSNNQGWVFDPAPSPDGRYLLYTEKTSPSEVMLLENF
ncbi:MAG: protein kinase [Candidatus Korobacteraceae bacterium]